MSSPLTNSRSAFLMGYFVGTSKQADFTSNWNGLYSNLPDGRFLLANGTIMGEANQGIIEFVYQTPGIKKANDMPYPFRWYVSAVSNAGGVRNLKDAECSFVILEELNSGKGHIDCLRYFKNGEMLEGAYKVCDALKVDAADAVYLLGSLAENERSKQWADAKRNRDELFELFAHEFEIEI